MQEHCIDVYFNCNGIPFYVLTYGTIIPTALNDVDRNRELQHQVAIDLESRGNIVNVQIEQNYVNAIIRDSRQASESLSQNEELQPNEETVVQLFKPMAELGFYSYDCVKELEGGRGLYRLVAYPGIILRPRVHDDLPVFTDIIVVERNEERNLIVMFEM